MVMVIVSGRERRRPDLESRLLIGQWRKLQSESSLDGPTPVKN
jgi:hypothetical protein